MRRFLYTLKFNEQIQKNWIAFFVVLIVVTSSTLAQSRQKMALFIPLHLDSAFDDGGSYRYNKTFPKYLNPGVEFYLGAQAA
jgi:hypothetical protein